ncbi:MAG TPA: TIM-barrel domain-containing protein [Streptosporangiaceae bacterium]|nr:TIM-barrel domain-containing protein [Streptosporangiaceae bacterium]
MGSFRPVAGGLEWRNAEQFVRIEGWGPDSLRVRSGVGRLLHDLPGALLEPDRTAYPEPVVELPPASAISHSPEATIGAAIGVTGPSAVLRHGALQAQVSPAGLVTFVRADGAELLAEQPAHFWWPGARHFDPLGNGRYRIEQRFRAYEDERIYGLGQHQHGLLDQKGAVIDLVQRNTEVSIPFLLSSRGYGLLWNNPAVGAVELAGSGTRWSANQARQIDYWITAAPDPTQILSRYADATGHSPDLPAWASGFWQSKLRYRTQEELMAVAREYQRSGLPLSVIVADFFHWPALGDWAFDPADWPDPKQMVTELDALGVKLMVSVWPSVNPVSENWDELSGRGLLIGTQSGLPLHTRWIDKPSPEPTPVAFYDATNPKAREFVWNEVARNYVLHGITAFWLDACEPEIVPLHHANLSFWAGNGAEVANIYPREHARGFFEGAAAAGGEVSVALCRSAWAGSQRYGVALWSGDIGVDFPSLRRQIAAGLNTAISGLPWWCADIGGFHGGDPDDPAYQELMIRWFQFGALSPIFRMHGHREPRTPLGPGIAGGPNEVWSYGSRAAEIMTAYLSLRERLRPYLHQQMAAAADSGLPPMRALFLEFPHDPACWTVADQYFLGPDLLVAPVVEAGATSREVYLPAGARWRDAWTGQSLRGGQTVQCPAPLDRIPLFLRDDAQLPILASQPE